MLHTNIKIENKPMMSDQILNPFSAHSTLIERLSTSMINMKIRYMFSSTLAALVMLRQLSDGKIDLKNILNTP